MAWIRMHDDTDTPMPRLWMVMFNVIDSCYYAACYLCLDDDGLPWFGDPASTRDYVQPELDSHVAGEAHRKLADALGLGERR